MRVVMTRVLPVPAPARTRRGPSVVETASRWAGLRRREEGAVGPGGAAPGRGGGVRWVVTKGALIPRRGRGSARAPVSAKMPGSPHALRQHVPRGPHRAGRVPPARRQRRVGLRAAPPGTRVSSRCRSPGGIATFTGRGLPAQQGGGASASPDRSTRASLAAVERAFAERGCARTGGGVEPRRPRGRVRMLTGRGYRLQGFENVLGRSPAGRAPRAAPGGRRGLAEPGRGAAATWLDVVVTGFASPDAQGVASDESYPRDLARERDGRHGGSAEGFSRYPRAARRRARGRGQPAPLRRAWPTSAGRRPCPTTGASGVQSALLAARLEIAGRRRLRRGRGHDAAGVEVAGERPAPGVRAALRAGDPRARGVRRR